MESPEIARAHARAVDAIERLREAVADAAAAYPAAERSLTGIRISLDGWAETWLDDQRER